MLHGFYADREAIPQTKAGSEKTAMRVLIGKDDGAEIFSMRVITIDKCGQIGMHEHPWEHEIFVLRGEGIAKTETERVEMKHGEYFFIPSGVIHGFDNTGDGPLEFICCIPNK
jgi:quercetin dioxygenase-like cupin family protein